MMKIFHFVLVSIIFTFFPKIISGQIIDTLVPIYRTLVFFDNDQFDLDTSEVRKFGTMLNVARQLDTFLISVNAHTDEIGSIEYNEELSRKRLNTIVSILQRDWIQEEQILKKYSGESEILAKGENAQNRRGEIVLYEPLKLIKVEGRIVDIDSKEGIEGEVMINTWTYRAKTKTEKDGQFALLAPLGEKASLTVKADNYFVEGNLINIHKGLMTNKIQIPMSLIEVGRRYIFKNLNFYGDKATLLAYSYFPLRQLQSFLKENEDLCVEIEGHINLPNQDSAGVETFHFDLSVARALTIRDELLGSGISEDRLLARGYANWMMKYPKAFTARQQEANRRVTFSIRDCEDTSGESDHEVEDLGKYQLEPLEWKFKADQINRTFPNDKRMRIAIYAAALNATKEGKNPEDYTYIELLRMNTF